MIKFDLIYFLIKNYLQEEIKSNFLIHKFYHFKALLIA